MEHTPNPDVAEIAASLTEAERGYLLVTPLQEPLDAGMITYRSGHFTGGGPFAMFARKNPKLFQRVKNVPGTAWLYRLSEQGARVRTLIERKDHGR